MDTKLTAMTKTQLANLYGMGRKGFVKKCIRDGIVFGRGLVMPYVILQIFEKYGDPR